MNTVEHKLNRLGPFICSVYLCSVGELTKKNLRFDSVNNN